MSQHSGAIDILIRRLVRSSGLEERELEELRMLPLSPRKLDKNETISREGERVDQCILIVDGFLARYQDTRDGKRQILSFYVPGDIPDLQTLHLPTMDHNLETVTPATIAAIPHQALLELCERDHGIANALWRETLIDGSVTRAWLRRVGRLPAHARVAELLCELYARLDAVGLAENPIRMPITQSTLADAAALSVVQMNVSLGDLRNDGLISIKNREMIVHDWPRLQRVAEFDPLYLHLDPATRR